MQRGQIGQRAGGRGDETVKNAEQPAGRARIAGSGAPSGTHPDQQQAAQEIAEALGHALGAEVQVRPTRAGGYRAELSFSSPLEAMELARRLDQSALDSAAAGD